MASHERRIRGPAKDLELLVGQSHSQSLNRVTRQPSSPAILFPGKSFNDENRIFRKRTSGSARLRWVSEYSEHRRPATRQRGICGSSLEQSVPDFSEARMTAENGPSKSFGDPVPAGSSTERRTPKF